MKRIISLVILIIILSSFSMNIFATTDESLTEEVSPMYIHIMTLSAYIGIDKLGIATCSANMTQGLSSGSCELIMNLQKLNSDNSWNTIATWTKEGIMKCANEQFRAVSKGTYRLSVTGKVYNGSGNLIETEIVNSISRTY